MSDGRTLPPGPLKIYFAGKIAPVDWRHTLVPALHDLSSNLDRPNERWRDYEQQCITNNHRLPYGHTYCGPFFENMGGHNLGHGPTSHGVGLYEYPGDGRRIATAYACREAIKRADVFFAWIDRADIYGTLVELGYATALRDACVTGYRRPIIVIATPPDGAFDAYSGVATGQHGGFDYGDTSDLWFAHVLADYRTIASDPVQAVHRFLSHARSLTGKPLKARPTQRKGIHPAIRWFIIQRADYTCAYCGRRNHSSRVGPDGESWNLDHADPLARGGIDEPENLVLSCASCNRQKYTKRPHEFRP